jgi:hypothetical protein
VTIPTSPEIGDLRIRFEVVRPGQVVSVMSGQFANELRPFKTGPTTEANWLEMGTVSKDDMLRSQEDRSNMMTWLMRLGGMLMMFIGMLLMMRPLTALAGMVPILGRVVGFAAFAIALLVSLALSLATIAVSWVFARPIIGIPLLAVSLALAIGAIVFLIRRRTPADAFGTAGR